LMDVLPLMTDAFAAKTKTFVASAVSPTVFYGVTAHALTVHVDVLDEKTGRATIRVKTQKEISKGSTQNTSVSYQEIKLTLVKQAGVWKVDSANWL